MTCEAMWIVASFHSTSLPFIQILPVPGNPIRLAPYDDSNAFDFLYRFTASLRFSAERASIRARVQRLGAMPAEARLGGFPRPEATLNVLDVAHGGLGRSRSTGPAAARNLTRGEQIVEK